MAKIGQCQMFAILEFTGRGAGSRQFTLVGRECGQTCPGCAQNPAGQRDSYRICDGSAVWSPVGRTCSADTLHVHVQLLCRFSTNDQPTFSWEESMGDTQEMAPPP